MKKLILATLGLVLILSGCGQTAIGEGKNEETLKQERPQSITVGQEEKTLDLSEIKLINKSETNTMTLEEKLNMSKPTENYIEAGKSYEVVLKTSEGDITISLNSDETPVTVNNFLYLAKNGFYGDTIFHRIIKGFMIQGGDPKGTGSGGPDYRFDDEPITKEYTRGTVAMANAGPNTNGSQFFIMHADYALPKNYVIFGKVAEGLEVVDKIAEAEVNPGGEGSSPVEPVVVSSVEILSDPVGSALGGEK